MLLTAFRQWCFNYSIITIFVHTQTLITQLINSCEQWRANDFKIGGAAIFRRASVKSSSVQNSRPGGGGANRNFSLAIASLLHKTLIRYPKNRLPTHKKRSLIWGCGQKSGGAAAKVGVRLQKVGVR